MKTIVDAHQIAHIDACAIQDYQMGAELLMGFAGKGIFDFLRQFQPRKVVILCGKGNNGGDGLVLAHFLHNNTIPYHLLLVNEPEQFSATASYFWHILQRQQTPYSLVSTEEDFTQCLNAAAKESLPLLLVDALFGTGLNSALSGRYKQMARIWNEHQSRDCLKIAIDIPSGINGSGEKLGSHFFVSDYTLTMGHPKVGLYTLPGRQASGQISVIDIGFPKQIYSQNGDYGYILEESDFFVGSAYLPPMLNMSAHKYHRGVAHIIAGSPGMEGAAMLAAIAAQLAGAGLVKVYTDQQSAKQLAGLQPGIQVVGLQTSQQFATILTQILASRYRQSLAIGPGLGRSPFAQSLLQTLLEHYRQSQRKPTLIIDADACVMLNKCLNAKDYQTTFLDANGLCQAIVTPHDGELLSMFDYKENIAESSEAVEPTSIKNKNLTSAAMQTMALKASTAILGNEKSADKGSEHAGTEEILAQKAQEAIETFGNNKLLGLQKLSQLFGLTIVGKGADTIISHQHGPYYINTTGNALLAKGGSGDILTGMIAGFSATNMPPGNACSSAVYLLGRAADLLLAEKGPYVSNCQSLLSEIEKLLSHYGRKRTN